MADKLKKEPFADYDDEDRGETRRGKQMQQPVPFWSENPNILFNPQYVYEFYPSDEMSYSQKLNAISRTIFVLTIITFLITRTARSVIFGVVSLATVYLVHMYYFKEREKNRQKKEGFDNELGGMTKLAARAPSDTWESSQTESNSPALAALAERGLARPSADLFDSSTAENPFSNVLVSDYSDNPNKKPAPPAFNRNVADNIMQNARNLVQQANPDQPEIADKLFKDLGEQLAFEQSMRPFYSTANTTIPNDQEAFSDFCYGSMVSCKEGNMFACARNMSQRQTLV